ncbi:MAG TPA: hypothetical protein VGI92_00005, partial [Gemmatimonadales bacterium]
MLRDLARLATREGERPPAASADVRRAAAVDEMAAALLEPPAADRVVGRLEDVLADRPSDVAAINDAMVARVVRAQVRQDPLDLLHALSQAEHLARLDSGSLVFAFNRAVLRERLGLRDEAGDSWRGYLTRDSISGWAGEARRRLTTLAFSSPPRDPQFVRERIVDSLLPAWGQAVVDGDRSAAGVLLVRAGAEADSLAHATGDGSALLAVQAVRSDPESRDLASGLAAYGTGRAAFIGYRFEDAERALTRSARSLSALPSLAVWPEMLLGAVDIYNRRYGKAEALYRVALASGDSASRVAQAGRAAWGLGLSLARQSRDRDAIRWFGVARSRFVTAGERLNAAAVDVQIGGLAGDLGDVRRGFASEYAALLALADARDSPYRHTALLIVGRLSMDQGEVEAAV